MPNPKVQPESKAMSAARAVGRGAASTYGFVEAGVQWARKHPKVAVPTIVGGAIAAAVVGPEALGAVGLEEAAGAAGTWGGRGLLAYKGGKLSAATGGILHGTVSPEARREFNDHWAEGTTRAKGFASWLGARLPVAATDSVNSFGFSP